MVCVGTQCVPSVATCVVAKIYRPIFYCQHAVEALIVIAGERVQVTATEQLELELLNLVRSARVVEGITEYA